MGHQELLRQLHKRLLARASQKEASEVLGISASGMSRKLKGEIPFTLPEFLTLTEHFGIDIHELADSAGFHSNGPFGWGILATLGEKRVDDGIEELCKRMIRRLTEPVPEGGFDFAPTSEFYRVEQLQRTSRPDFHRNVDDLRATFIRQNRFRHKYNASDIQALTEILDLSARRYVESVPQANYFLQLALSSPLQANSLLRLYSEEIASKLIQQTHLHLAERYIQATLSKTIVVDDTLTARLLLLLSVNQSQRQENQLSIATNQRILKLDNVRDSLLKRRALFNLANDFNRSGNQEEALRLINSLPIEDIQDDPHFTFDLLWFGGKLRLHHGDPTGTSMLVTALHHRPDLQRPLKLLMLLEDLVPLLPRDLVLGEAQEVAPYIRNLASQEALKIANKFLHSLRQGPIFPLGLALNQLQDPKKVSR